MVTATARTNRWPLLAVCLGFFMIMIDATVVTTALPDIAKDLGASASGSQWVLDAYTVPLACLLLPAGAVGDRLGSRRVFLLGLGLFTAASAVCGLAPTLPVLIAARVAQGVGAALTLPTSLALINASYPDRMDRARAIGVWGGLGGVAAGLGPVLGGVLTGGVGWPLIFYVNIPIGVFTIFATRRHVVAPRPGERIGLDFAGLALSTIAVAGLVFGLIQGSVIAFVVAGLGAVAFVVTEATVRHPMLPLNLFRGKQFPGSVAVGAAINFGFYGELFLLALYFQHIRHLSPLLAGLALLPQPGGLSLASWLGGRHTARYGPRLVMLIGLPVGVLGMLAMTLVGAATPYWMMVFPMVAIGFGTAYTMPAGTAATIEAAPSDLAGTASGTFNASRQIGSALGVAIFGSLAAVDFVAGFHTSVVVGALVFAAAAVTTWLTVRPARTAPR
jgi:DHA2 family methylenomycin A resistance protein-like MFS transporter